MTLRSDIVQKANTDVIGVELGVAEGFFSSEVLQHQPVKHWYSIDMWAGDRGHGEFQYRQACRTLEPYQHKNTIIRKRFDQVVADFEDEYFDFIYIDGYAHTGQEGGQTLTDWWPKLKPGGVFAGDDYHSDWPLTVKAVDSFCEQHQLTLQLHHFELKNNWSRYPSWYAIKTNV